MRRWLQRVRHDLVKHPVWRARDLRDAGGSPSRADLAALARGLLALPDEDGAPTTASALWQTLRAEAPARAGAQDALDAFGRAVQRAEDAVRILAGADGGLGDDGALVEPVARVLDAVLALETAFAALTRELGG